MRLIDVDALKKEWGMANKCEDCPRDARQCQFGMVLTRMDFCQMLDEAPTVGGWISVEEKMPEEGTWVLACEKDGFMFIDIRENGEWKIGVQALAVITHWMPLPEPLKGVSKDGSY